MPRRMKFVPEPTETVKLAIEQLFQKVLSSDDSEFPLVSSLTAEQRAYVHMKARRMGLKSKSRGKGSKRYLTIYKPDGSTIVQRDAMLLLSAPNKQLLENIVTKFPLTHKERQDLTPSNDRDRAQSNEAPLKFGKAAVTSKPVQIPPAPKTTSEMENFRKNLPIYKKRAQILETISSNAVCIIQGETGCGKTTQVPQYILEEAREQKLGCRVIVTEPRRLACTSACERVSLERNEPAGSVVGYQIRLESKLSNETILTFCTPGIMITTLMSEASMANMTHIVVDEVHERDRFCDFMLICLRDLRARYPHLRIILMSATVNTSMFEKYFNCPVVSVPGRSYAVQEIYLHDILKLTKHSNKKMVQFQEKAKEGLPGELEVTSLLASDAPPEITDPTEIDPYIDRAFNCGDEESLMQLLHAVLTQDHPIDSKHTTTWTTPLMAAAARNHVAMVQMLLMYGANPLLRTRSGMTALEIARTAQANDTVNFLETYTGFTAVQGESKLTDEEQLLVESYTSTTSENIDADLIVKLIIYIHRNKPQGAILVFLPGCEQMMKVRERFRAEEQHIGGGLRSRLYLLHSQFRNDSKTVFKPAPDRTRKIILATNIAETSITINDVVYVIDAGKVNQKSLDSLNGVSQLDVVWISKACAEQRKGRAGRCQAGLCYRLYTKQRYNSFSPFTPPEILRSANTDLCLHAKMFVQLNNNVSIAEFLGKAVEPPPQRVTRETVQLLKTIDALHPCEELTILGSCLCQLTTEPRLGKTLLYATMLKCLDPALTIVSCLDYRDAFVIPQNSDDRARLKRIRSKLSEGTMSDHFVLLRLFQGWQQALVNRTDRAYCDEHFISPSVMEMIQSTRTQLLGQLRSLGLVRKQTGDIREINANSDSWAVVKAAICAGLYPNIGRVDNEQNVLRTRKECKVVFHGGCVIMQDCSKGLNKLPTEWVVYNELVKVGRFSHFKTCSLISPLTVALFSGSPKLSAEALHEDVRPEFMEAGSDSEAEGEVNSLAPIYVDNWIEFVSNPGEANDLSQLRLKLNSIFTRRLTACVHPQKVNASTLQADDAVIKDVVNIINNAERELNMPQPVGVGQRPRNLDDHLSNSVGNMQIGGGRRWQRMGESNESHDNVKYFLIRTPSLRALENAFLRCNWQFSQPTERKLLTVVRDEGRDLILFFTTNNSAMFHGVARLRGSQQLEAGQPWPLLWLKKHTVPFNAARNISVGSQEFRRYNFTRDGLEIPDALGRALLRLWDQPLMGQRPYIEDGYRGIRAWPQFIPRHM